VALSRVDVGADPLQLPWLTFDGDGQVYGFAGVNRVRGTWVLEGDRLSFGPVASTLMAGPDPSMAVEREVLRLLSEVVTVAVGDDGTLQLTGADGAGARLSTQPPVSYVV
jgi:heat shock protein HslJ